MSRWVKGKQYGLFDPKKAIPLKKPSFFSTDEEEQGPDVKTLLALQAKKKEQQMKELSKKYQEENPDIYAYDEVYDTLKEEEIKIQERAEEERMRRKPKYAAALIQKAKKRELENDILYHKKLQREKEKDSDQFADKEKFVTSSYKKKLELQQKAIEEQQKIDEKDEDVTKNKNFMYNFYNKVYDKKNVALGGQDQDSEPKSNDDRKTEREKSEIPKSRKYGSDEEDDERERVGKRYEKNEQTNRRNLKYSDPRDRNEGRKGTSSSESEDEQKYRETRKRKERDYQSDKGGKKAKHEKVKDQKSEEDELEQFLKERHDRLKSLMARRNDVAAIEAARQRFLARKRARQ